MDKGPLPDVDALLLGLRSISKMDRVARRNFIVPSRNTQGRMHGWDQPNAFFQDVVQVGQVADGVEQGVDFVLGELVDVVERDTRCSGQELFSQSVLDVGVFGKEPEGPCYGERGCVGPGEHEGVHVVQDVFV